MQGRIRSLILISSMGCDVIGDRALGLCSKMRNIVWHICKTFLFVIQILIQQNEFGDGIRYKIVGISMVPYSKEIDLC